MNKLIFFFVLLITANNLISQDINISATSQPVKVFIVDVNSYVKKYVEQKINLWQQKGEFEKTSDYQIRVSTENRNKKIQEYTEEGLGELKKEYARQIDWSAIKIKEYDADNESYLVSSPLLGNFALKVPIENAPLVKQKWNELQMSKIDFYVNDNNFTLAYIEFNSPNDNLTFIYDSKIPTAYQTTNIQFSFDNIQINLPSQQPPVAAQNISQANVAVGSSDVDINIPDGDSEKLKTYVLIVGNEDYTKYQNDLSSESNVFFARNDATVFAKYCEKTLRIPKSNITLLTDAISTQMRREIIRLIDKAKYSDGDVELIFYYSGHGFPDNETQESYIMPVDISGANVRDGIKLSQLYIDLTQHPAKKVTVILDACFSGGGRQQGLLSAKAVKLKPKEEAVSGNLVVFSASSGDQESLFYKEKQHGMFTYFFLKKLQETKGQVTYGDMFDFVKMKVPLTSSDINYKVQNPQVNFNENLGDTWRNWKF